VILEQAIENIDGFPDTAGAEVTEQGDVRVTDMMVRDAPATAIPHMLLAQEIVPEEGNVRTIGTGRLSTAPQPRQGKPGVFRNDGAPGGLQFRGRYALLVDSSRTCRLIRPLVWRAVWEAPAHGVKTGKIYRQTGSER
jgi:hypothetical protein